jgi:hypothetical protein
MIPIVHSGSTDSTWYVANNYINGHWYDYETQVWANAVTVTRDAINEYKYKNDDGSLNFGEPIDEADVLGYWVYVPRYAYEVQRYYSWGKPVCGNGGFGGGYYAADTYADVDCADHYHDSYQSRFNIHFEKATDPKKIPSPGDTICATPPASRVAADSYNTGFNYRTECGVNRNYGDPEGTTWATHPAFSVDKNGDGDYNDPGEELSGLWIGKFETGTDFFCYNVTASKPVSCGGNTAPGADAGGVVIKPNKSPMVLKKIGTMFTIAKNMSPNAASVTGGNTINNTTVPDINNVINTMNLSSSSVTKVLKNSEWGAVAYLSTSQYGASAVQPRVYSNGYADGTVKSNKPCTVSSSGVATNCGYVTGAGPKNDSPGYNDGGYNTNVNQYHTAIGQLASTTGNIYGIYDMAGGVEEYVMGNVTTSNTQTTTSSSQLATPIDSSAYYDAYRTSAGFNTRPAWSWNGANDGRFYNFDVCTWATCGGHALYEVSIVQSMYNNSKSLWNNDASNMPGLHTDGTYSYWTVRGNKPAGQADGIFASLYGAGADVNDTGFRVSLSTF